MIPPFAVVMKIITSCKTAPYPAGAEPDSVENQHHGTLKREY
ncbi:hypothetical protein CENDO_00070 [Corynebacterium endometrii]|uniref:Uncharacterized protein n=1 Tax=Corynebacterium endometrii TaxID=2488819 RepID=A0A4P7QEQ9_9CORY|nr:hypothetical protein CENDO_00070 [Corynebacterium endometrii]